MRRPGDIRLVYEYFSPGKYCTLIKERGRNMEDIMRIFWMFFNILLQKKKKYPTNYKRKRGFGW